MNFGNIATAMVTPFDKNENIDFQKLSKLIDYLINNGTDSLVVAGTTGESPTLSEEEKVALIQYSVKEAAGRVPIIAGTGSNNTKASIKLTKKAEEAGADAVMLVTPYYNKPSQEGMYRHFRAIAEETSLPVMLYNVPGRTAASLAPETTIRLAEIPNIIAIKEASGDLDAITKIVAETPEDFAVYSGDDSLTLPALSVGARGIVSVASHIIGPEMQEMIKHYTEGNTAQAALIHQKLLPLMKGLFAAPNPSPLKTALQLKGLDVGSVRLPLIPLNEDERLRLSSLMNGL
ncbi:4-hydroxy-tetrahydrodipicolinate synthase [Bacillus paralicheniformis]|uniref:4-hydroxy-tetrahydrodipicolinate synthase n=1 Tax=Bacillus paralicheniformis TaxID=1648923 RepID=A0A6I7U2K5_9BACI|nr:MULTISPECIES: 4-hydroxy-tetrahydrodipicolinate synthase [Bacillus]ETB69684.1 dihydrodipicolinate synthase [Bacillus sp. CPSM8]KJD52374.1 dihydrodipicolinate synthase [Bacillus amyloliquefaciens]KUL07555.1 dihydrodipicolinate synthase [Bacillus licheniformis LMG 7559]KUL19280.1 dihydrodipicolinate synthase [Bacillus licheniformis LMG 6934]MBC8622684.1 4-hydroxy-tetrahydrodipicolinate synthase [Robertmurraya crescens]POO82819.1 4-hydroxy-tetrahydrodipicolinate synthase [Bacillus sp. MBGLi97]